MLGQIIFPATGSWALKIISELDDNFLVEDRIKILKSAGSCVSASLPMISIPKNMCDNITGQYINPQYIISGFDETNNGPVYHYKGNSYSILF